ncbi:MAG: radical SAM protein [Candidatus Omnitrophica bacterium]|nr:radical SAM protein [Candidatus Omnitrophota bacterium]
MKADLRISQKRYKKIFLLKLSSSAVGKYRPSAHFFPSLTLKYMEALLRKRKDTDVQLIDCYIRKYSIDHLVQVLQKGTPDIIVVDINFYEYSTCTRLLKRLKEHLSTLVIAVGSDPTIRFSDYFEDSDLFQIVLPGEVEEELLCVLDALNKGDPIDVIRERYRERFERDGPVIVNDLACLPFPAYDEYEREKYRFVYPLRMRRRVKWGYILSSRGCPYKCRFCSPAIRKTYGRDFRARTASNIVDEIEHLMRNYNVNVISFEDDNFTTDRLHVEGVCNEILHRDIKIKWIVHARVDNVDFSLLALMKKAGCELLRFGIESGSPKIIRLIQKTNRRDWNSKAIQAFRDARKLQIGTLALFMLGIPTETEEDIKESFSLLNSLNPDFIQIHFFTPYLGSDFYEEFKPLLKISGEKSFYHYAIPPLSFSNVGVEELKKWRKYFYKKFLFRPRNMIRHAYNYGCFYLFNLDVFFELLKMRIYLKDE